MQASKSSGLALKVGVVAALAVGGVAMGVAQRGTDYSFYDDLVDVKHMIDTLYVDEVDDDELRIGAIEGMLDVLDDRYTAYVPAVDRADFDKQLMGKYVGIGAQINVQDGWLTVVSPLEESPAYRAGLMAGDRVSKIDGTSTFGKPADECVELLSGEPGTPVTLTIEREGEEFDVEIVRARIQTRAVKGYRFDGEGEAWDHLIDPQRRIAYVRLTQFTPGVTGQVRDALLGLPGGDGQEAAPGGAVIDLRGNPGGVLQEAVALADLFLSEGTIVSTRGRAHPESVDEATSRGTLPDFPLVVLIDPQSASASEVLSGALSDHGRAIVVGERTFGKGSVQTVRALSRGDGSQVKLTEQRYYLPSGRSIQRKDESPVWGVDPTEGYHVAMSREQYIEMLRARRELTVVQRGENGTEPDWSDPHWIEHELKDVQLAAAVEAIKIRIDSGEWIATGDDGVSGEELAMDELRALRTRRERLKRELSRVDTRVRRLEVAAESMDDGSSARDLWPDETDVSGGRVEIYDGNGVAVTTLRIVGADLERWLIDAGVEPKDDEGDESSGVSPGGPN